MEFRGEVTSSAWESVCFLFMVISISRRSQVQSTIRHSGNAPWASVPVLPWLSCQVRFQSEATPFQSPSVPGFSAQAEKYPPWGSPSGSHLSSSGPRLGWSAFHPSSCRGYSRMDRSLDTAAWENFSHKPDLIHLSCWQPEAHQASSWLFASSKRLTPRRSP